MQDYLLGCCVLGEEMTTVPYITYTDYATVLAVQKALVAKGFPLKKGVDGKYGQDTKQAIEAMQKSLGVAQNGVIDYGVLAALGITEPKIMPVTTDSKKSASKPASDSLTQSLPAAPDVPAVDRVEVKKETPKWKIGLGIGALGAIVVGLLMRNR